MKPAQYAAVEEIPIAEIEFIPNPRQELEQSAIQELAGSIKVVGVIHAVTVIRQGGIKLVTGQRRLLASMLAGKKTIKAQELLNPTPELIAEIQLIENCQRKDIHPIEEWQAFEKLKWNAAEIAVRIGKPVQYVNDRFKLGLLAQEVLDLFATDVLTFSHALQFAKVSKAEQVKLLPNILFTKGAGEEKQVIGTMSVTQLKNVITRNATVGLDCARFNVSDKNLLRSAGSCDTCKKRSGNNKSLFGDVVEGDLCFDVACFDKKAFNYCLQLEKGMHDQGLPVVRLTGLYNQPDAEQLQLVNDFMQDVQPYKHQVTEGYSVGIYFRDSNRANVGSMVHVKTKVKTQVNENEAKAREAFQTSLMNAIGHKIGEFDCDSIPLPATKHLAVVVFLQMCAESQAAILKNYRWKIQTGDADAYRVELIKQMDGWQYEQTIRFLLTCMYFDFLRTADATAPEYTLVSQLCTTWGIDILAMAGKVEEKHQVKGVLIKPLL